jgi:hypothetical protein
LKAESSILNPGNLQEQLNAAVEKGNLDEMKKSMSYLKSHLQIPDNISKAAKTELEDSYKFAEETVSRVGGGVDEIAKMWGYQYGPFLYNHLSKRDSLEGLQSLSFIKMALGYELSAHGFTEVQFASFVLGLGLRFLIGFENLKKSIGNLENELKRLESLPHDE